MQIRTGTRSLGVLAPVAALAILVLSWPGLTRAQLATEVTPLPPPGSLKKIPVPRPSNLYDFVQNEAAAIRLGKALFWDMQVGSDGIQACASCHFHAGADSRTKNQLSPGLNHGGTTFEVAGPNTDMTPAKFPFHRLLDPDDANSLLLFDADDVMSSQGVFFADFTDVVPGLAADRCIYKPDPVFNVRGITTRRAEPRNTPTAINAVHNVRNFWDGRAAMFFNGVDPVGPRNPNARVLKVLSDGSVVPVAVSIDHGSAASQAVGPPGSPFEMSCGGRTFPKIGKKLLSLTPLAKQLVDPNDSMLGSLSKARTRPGTPGLTATYTDMIKAAFDPKWWNSTSTVTFSPSGAPIVGPPVSSRTTSQYSVMEANFSLFFGLAIQLYESTLISDDAPFDRFEEGQTSALTAQQLDGFSIFMRDGNCIACHTGATFSGATFQNLGVEAFPEPPIPEGPVEQMQMALDEALNVLAFTRPAIGVPAPNPLTFEPRGALVEILQGTGPSAPVAFAGIFPGTPGSCAAGPTLAIFPPTGAGTVGPFPLAHGTFNVLPDCSRDFTVALENVPVGTYSLRVGGIGHGSFPVVSVGGSSEGSILFAAGAGPIPPPSPLTFDPRGTLIQVTQGTSCTDPVAFARPFPGVPATCDPLVSIDATRIFEALFDLPPTGAVALGPFPFAGVAFNVAADCSADLTVELLSVPGGTYTVCFDGVSRGQITVNTNSFYDHGFYNIAVRPTTEDLGVGGEAGGPIAFSRRVQLGLPTPELSGFSVPTISPDARISVDGSFKAPSLRNVELTAPYMHNGGMLTLDQVVDFYTRGTDFSLVNIQNLDPEVAGISALRGNPTRKANLVAFLKSLTDDRVRYQVAPFDHPQIFVPNGHPGNEISVQSDGTGKARDTLLEVPAVGAAGSCTGIDGSTDGCARGEVVADVMVSSAKASSNFGALPYLEADSSPSEQTLLRVQVRGTSGRQISRALLRFTVTNASGATSAVGGRIREVDCDWDEDFVTFKTKPALGNAVLATLGKVATLGMPASFDVTSAIHGDGEYCFALDSTSSDNVRYDSREAGATGPRLDIELVGPTVAACGDGKVNQPREVCDGADNAVCPGRCRRDCTCPPPPVCGDNEVNRVAEQCDGTADAACPGTCRADCTCPIPPTATIEADAYVDSANASKKFGTTKTMMADASPAKESYLRVRVTGVSGRPVTGAILRLTATSSSAASSPSGGRLHTLGLCDFVEDTVTWTARPAMNPAIVASAGAVAKKATVDFDVSSVITGDGVYCFGLFPAQWDPKLGIHVT